MSVLELPGLDGTNPMGFLAALGTLVVATRERREVAEATLCWNDDVLPTPALTGPTSVDELIDWVLRDRERVLSSAAFRDPSNGASLDDVKFATPEETRAYLSACRAADDGGLSEEMAVAMVAEASLDGQDKAKPTDLHFSAGQQKFLGSASEIGESIARADLEEAVQGSWSYSSDVKSLGWDVADDRVYALTATNPAKDAKKTVPGADWLAFRGLAVLPVVGDVGRTRGPGQDGSWKRGSYTWPLWSTALTLPACRWLLAQAGGSQLWGQIASGVFRILRSRIVRSEQGGYGTFRPPRIIA